MCKRICGVQISGSEARFVILKEKNSNFEIINIGIKKIKLKEYNNQNKIKSFKETVENFFKHENCSKVFIKARAIKGNYRGGSVSFIIEGIIQTLDIEVEVVQPVTISNYFKSNQLCIDLNELNIYKYQHDAFKVAYYGLDN